MGTNSLCGNNVKDEGEDCDYGDNYEGRCRPDCQWRRCGDGVLDTQLAIDTNNDGLGDRPELCDWGIDGGPPCRRDCLGSGICGDGTRDPGEGCDDGANNSDSLPGACRINCQRSSCGDGVLDPTEECEDSNTQDGDGCDSNCKPTGCGNGVITAGEECDDGEGNSDLSPRSCRNDCTRMRCGDLRQDPGEQCDDGNLVSGDGCDSNCTPTGCGNEAVSPGEECDDGNELNVDACRPDCTLNVCNGGVGADGLPCFRVIALPLPPGDPQSVKIGDLDGDGWKEIVLADRADDTVKIFWNSPSGFDPVREIWVAPGFTLFGDRPVDVELGDLDADGNVDLVSANEMGDRLCILENLGGRSFDKHFYAIGNFPTELALADFDGNPGVELAVGLNNDKLIRILRLSSSGFGSLQSMQTINTLLPTSLAVGDLGGDGDQDLAWAAGIYKDVSALPYVGVNSSGALSSQSVADGELQSLTVRLFDLGAGRAVVVAGVYGAVLQPHLRVFSNPFVDHPTRKWPVHLAHSGSRLAYTDNGGTFGVFEAQGGTLLSERTFTYEGDAKGLAAGDLDNDGTIDLAIASPSQNAVLVFVGRAP